MDIESNSAVPTPFEWRPPDHLLSVVAEPDGQQIYIHGDRAGYELLARAIARLLEHLENNNCEHDHLFRWDWPGDELTTTMLQQEREASCIQVGHVKLYAWTDEWRKKHGL
ncbi:MAG: Imm32 family immunity protein [Candidatus Sumerlaeaceae bacterium]